MESVLGSVPDDARWQVERFLDEMERDPEGFGAYGQERIQAIEDLLMKVEGSP